MTMTATTRAMVTTATTTTTNTAAYPRTPMRYSCDSAVKRVRQLPSYTSPNAITHPTSAREDSQSSHPASPLRSQHSSSSVVDDDDDDQDQRNANGASAYDSLEDRFPFLKDDRKRTRKLLTPGQTRVLEAIWERTIYPSTSLREAVACQLAIGPRKVQIWFQNKRQGRRRHVRSPEGGQFVAFAGGDTRHHQSASQAVYRPRDPTRFRTTTVQSSRDQCIELQAAADDLRLAELRDEHGRPFAELEVVTPGAADYRMMNVQQMQRRHYVAQPSTAQQGDVLNRHPQQQNNYAPHHNVRAGAERLQALSGPSLAGARMAVDNAPMIMYSAVSEPSSLMHRRMQSSGRQGEQLRYLITPRTAPPPMQRAVAHADVHGRPYVPSPSLRPYYPLPSPRSADPTGWQSFCASHTSAGPSIISPRHVAYAPPSPAGQMDRAAGQSGDQDKQMIKLPPLTPLTASPGRRPASGEFERLSLTPTRARRASPASHEMLPSISEFVVSTRR